jgi:phenylacetate-coenzyme A ligase PaaK-like adenylate-forming protein
MRVFQTLRFVLHSLQLDRIPREPPEDVLRLQQERLRSLVRLVVERSPFYREKYRGVNLERFQLADLPPSGKRELMAHFDRAVTDPDVRRAELEQFLDDPTNLGRYFRGKYAVSHTSGSQGQPILLVQDARLVELLFSLQSTRGYAGTVNWVETVRHLWSPARLAVVTLKPGFYPTASAFAYVPPVVRAYLQVCRLHLTDPDLIEHLNAFRPTALTAYAHVLETLAQQADRLRLAPELRQIVNNSEALTDQARARIEAAFGVPVLDNYAMGECPFLSNGCTAGPGAHVNADWAILEVVDANANPVPAGTPGSRVLITNLANTIQPFLRYEVGDVVTMAADDGPCRCGSRLPKIERIEGRAAEVFWFQDETGYRQILATAFKNACDYLRGVREWQAVHEERNRVRVRVEPLPGAVIDEAQARAQLRRQLEWFGLPDNVVIELEVVPRLAPDPQTGKFRRVVNLTAAPAEALPAPAAAALEGGGAKTYTENRMPLAFREAPVIPAHTR